MALSCFVDSETRAARRVNRDIERQIRIWKKEQSSEHIILVLGNDKAGKSTLIKQMRIIHGKGYTEKDRAEFAGLVYRNIALTAQILAEAMVTLKIQYEREENRFAGNGFMKIDTRSINDIMDVSQDLQEKIKHFWVDTGVQTCFERRKEFQISESTIYYMNDLNRIFSKHYIPTLQDVVHVPVPVTGIREYRFQIGNHAVLRLIDGVDQILRRMRICVFEEATVVLFVTSINDYDQVLFEDEDQNRMHESLALFETILGYPWFRNLPFILFLNNYDLFKEKIMKSHLSDYFPQYKGPKQNHKEAAEFIKLMFMSVNEDPDKRIFPHFTTPTDTENIKRVFEDVKTTILEEDLRHCKIII